MAWADILRGPRNSRVRTPTVLQLEAVECGAACLGMVLAHHGRIVPLAQLRGECGVSRDGSKASNMVKAARRFGLLAKGFSKSVAGLRELRPPFIVFWNFNHFVVFEGFGKRGVYLNDPAVGHRTVSAGEFERSFTGVVLVMEPGPQFEPGGRRPSLVRAALSRLRGAEQAVAYCVAVGFLLVLPGLALPVLSQVVLDEVVLEGREDWLRPVLLGMCGAMALQAVLRVLQLRYLRRLKIRLGISLSSRYFWRLLRLPARFYAQRVPGEVANRSTLNDKLAETLSGQLAHTAIDVVMMGFYAALMLAYDVVLTAIGVAFALVNGIALHWVSHRRIEANMRVQQALGQAQGTAIAGLMSLETIKATGVEAGFFATWAGHYAKAINARQALELSNQALGLVPTLLSALAVTLVIVVGGLRIMDGALTIGMLVAFQSLMGGFLAPVNNLVRLGSTLQELKGDLERVDDVLDHPPVREPPAGPLWSADGQRIVRLKGYVELRGVQFGYNLLEAPLIDGFDLAIEPGQRVALVGGSGCGKTTVAKLVSGELEPWAGAILLDDVPRQDIPREVLVNSFATVDQDVQLFSGSVRENLTLWDTTVPHRNLLQACEDAGVLERVLALPGGFDAQLAENGANLSGGQRQRLEIARALVNEPSVLVLDEATSGLDAETEALVMERLRIRGCTALIVAHRLSTIRDCDEIVVLRDGRVVERGTHTDLWRAGGEYARLIAANEGSGEGSGVPSNGEAST